MTENTKTCRHCKSPNIHKKATVCIHCQRSQGRIESIIASGSGVINVLSITVSIALVVLAFLQYQAASQQKYSADLAMKQADDAFKQADDAFKQADDAFKRADKALIEADKALKQANTLREGLIKASTDAEVAKIEVERANVEIRNNKEELRYFTKLFLEMEALTPSMLDESYDPVRVGKVRQKLAEFAIPDEKERKKWQKSLKK